MKYIKDIIINTKNDIEQVSEMFYQGKNQDGFGKLIEVIDSITNIVTLIEKSTVEYQVGNETQALETSLKEATEAMINKDTVLLADILRYDITNLLNNLLNLVDEG